MHRMFRSMLVCTIGLIFVALSPIAPSSAAPKDSSPTVSSPKDSSPKASSSSPNCGPRVPKPTGGVWTCTFSDDFSGSALNTEKWTVSSETRAVTSLDCRVGTPETVSVGDGALKLTVLDTGAPFVCHSAFGDYTTQYAAGSVSTGRKFSQAFGRFEIRAAMPDVTVAGLHSSIWMWPQDRRYGSLSGEIDINERRSGLAEYAVPTVHYTDDGTAGPKSAWTCPIDSPQDFHTYGLEWTSTTLTFIYDGEVCMSHEWQPASPLSKPQPFDEPYFLILSQNLGGGHNVFDPAVTPLPASMVVDYVRAWS